MKKPTLIFCIGIFLILALSFKANATPHVVCGELSHEDDSYWYYAQTLSDGSKKEHKVRKPVYWVSRYLVATNEHPVTWEYVYEIKRCDGSIISNSVFQAKTKRERAQIKMPPMPEVVTPDPGKLDAFGHAVKRRKKAIKIDEEVIYKSMKKRDYIERREIKDGVIINRFKSGKVVEAPVKRLYTARVKSASVNDFKTHEDSNFSAIGNGGHKSPSFPAATINKTRDYSKDNIRRGNFFKD